MLRTHWSIGRSQRSDSTRSRSDSGFTLIELLIVVAVIGIIAALAVAGLLRARMAANEASAIGSMRTINSAQQAYAVSCANGLYAASLPILMSAPVGGTPFISPDLGAAVTVIKSGYQVTLTAASDAAAGTQAGCNPLGIAANLATGYYVTANWVGWGTGSRYFWTSTPGAIYVNQGGPIGHTQGTTSPAAPAQPLEAAP